jgi:hypothetical protein
MMIVTVSMAEEKYLVREGPRRETFEGINLFDDIRCSNRSSCFLFPLLPRYFLSPALF